MSENLLKGLSVLLEIVGDYSDSPMRTSLFHCAMGMMCTLQCFRDVVDDSEFLDSRLCVAYFQNGVFAYTIREYQANVHFLIPQTKRQQIAVVCEMVKFLESSEFDEVSLNLKPLKVLYPDIESYRWVKRKRIVPSKVASSELKYDGTTLTYYSVALDVVFIIDDLKDILFFIPVQRCEADWDEFAIFWTRVSNGSLLAFRNPYLPVVQANPFPPILCSERVLSLVPQSLHDFVNALSPASLGVASRSLRSDTIPAYTKPVLIRLFHAMFGCRDELLCAVANLVDKEEVAKEGTHAEMYQIAKMALLACSKTNPRKTATELCVTLASFRDLDAWAEWCVTSALVEDIVFKVDCETVKQMSLTYPAVLGNLIRVLWLRIGSWTAAERQRAGVVEILRVSGQTLEQVTDVLQEAKRLDTTTESLCKNLIASSGKTRGKLKKAAKKIQMFAAQPQLPATQPKAAEHVATHEKLLNAFCQKWPHFTWSLIGSGIFFDDGNDADLICQVEGANTLDEAYSIVQSATGFDLTTPVDCMNVAILRGTFDGTDVDIQVARNGGCTGAERRTFSALALTNRLRDEISTDKHHAITLQHKWFHAASLKSHRLGRLPGIAVTCIAVLFAARNYSFQCSLERIRNVLLNGAAFAFDGLETSEGKADCDRRPVTPVQVLMEARNLATRATAAWTRHFLDCVAYSLSLPASRVLAARAYDVWRESTMVVAAHVTPRSSSSVACTLNSALQNVSGHPVIDALHVREHPSGSISILCTIDHSAPLHYGFRESDEISACDSEVAWIRRNGKTFPLAVSPGGGDTASFKSLRSLKTCISLPGCGRVPNVPMLTVDVLQFFSGEHWKCNV